MNEDIRNKVIDLINSDTDAVKDLCALAFAMGHEDGWWLSRTDPDVTRNPIDHMKAVNPFTATSPAARMILDLREQQNDPQTPESSG